MQCWAYWILGQLEGTPEALSRSAGYYKALQSAGGAASWALSVQSSGVPPSVQAYVNVGLFALAFPLAAVAVLSSAALRDTPPRDPTIRRSDAPAEPVSPGKSRSRSGSGTLPPVDESAD